MSHASVQGIFLSNTIIFETALLTYLVFYANMVGSRNKFSKAARAACKGKLVSRTTGPPPKWLVVPRRLLCFLLLHPHITEKSAPIQLKSFIRDDSAAILVFIEPSSKNAGVESLWPHRIQYLVLALTLMTSLLEEPHLSVLIAKNALRP